jgi:hypothetical protein
MTEWLLIICIAYAGSSPGYCDSRGAVAAQKVTEQQCRSALVASPYLPAWCISPEGQTITKSRS